MFSSSSPLSLLLLPGDGVQERLAYILAGRMKSNGTPRVNAKKGAKHRHYVGNSTRPNNNPPVNNLNGAY